MPVLKMVRSTESLARITMEAPLMRQAKVRNFDYRIQKATALGEEPSTIYFGDEPLSNAGFIAHDLSRMQKNASPEGLASESRLLRTES